MDRRSKGVLNSILTMASVLAMAGCTGDADEIAECEEDLEGTVLSVDGVETADFTCRRDFGNPGERGTITLAVESQRDAMPVIEGVYRAIASESNIDGSSVPRIAFTSAGSGKEFNDDALGFTGDPYVKDMRDRYDIHP